MVVIEGSVVTSSKIVALPKWFASGMNVKISFSSIDACPLNTLFTAKYTLWFWFLIVFKS